jgi:CBS domain-containing protein
MAETSAQDLSVQPSAGTVADVMRPPVTTVDQDDHLAAAAYLMKRAGATALVVLAGDERTERPIGIITETDVVHAVADGKDVNDVRIHDAMTINPTVITAATSIRDAAEAMTSGRFRHLPVVGDAGLVGIVDIGDVCRALLGPPPDPPAVLARGGDPPDPPAVPARGGDPPDPPAVPAREGGPPDPPE